MMDQDTFYKQLLDRFVDNTATEDELEVIDHLIRNGELDSMLMVHMEESWQAEELAFEHKTEYSPRKVSLWPRVTAAIAAAVAAVVFGIWFFSGIRDQDTSIKTGSTASVVDIAPGKQGATLTLASGKTIKLSDAANGEIAKEAGISVTKTANGQLVYELASSPAASRNDRKTNTLSTAKGETYQLRLPDGSLVYLNAASSLNYSASLMDKGRRVVRLQGEAYFEIAKATRHSTSARDGRKSERVPFIVYAGNQQVEVLGTHFNINSYSDERAIKTTLLEGSVNVAAGGNSKLLSPGQQAVLTGNSLSVREVDPEEAIAWKNGYFNFNHDKLENIMNNIARWYDLTVEYEDPALKNQEFSGTVSRFKNVSQILDKLSLTDAVTFKIEGKKIIVKKYNK